MSLSEKAVEVAAKALEALGPLENVSRRKIARAVLAASGDLLMEIAWDEGYDEADHEPIYRHSPINPYRSAL